LVAFSHSRLSSYENCPAQYRYRYIDKVETPYEGVEAFMGKRVHEVLERLYHHVARHGKPPSLSQVLTRFERDWRFHWHENVRIVRTENAPSFYQETGARCLENYYRSHYPFDADETVGLEQAVQLVLDEQGKYRMRGIIDRLVRTAPGRYEVHDYKTSGSLPPRRRLEQDRQLPLYQIAVQQAFPDAREVELVWHYLAFNRTLRQQRTEEQLCTLRSETIELIDRVTTATDFPERPGPLCRWCDYRELCPVGAARFSTEEFRNSGEDLPGEGALAGEASFDGVSGLPGESSSLGAGSGPGAEPAGRSASSEQSAHEDAEAAAHGAGDSGRNPGQARAGDGRSRAANPAAAPPRRGQLSLL